MGADVRLERGTLECDVWAFREASGAGDPARAAKVYGGPFLDGFYLSGSAPFEKWLDRERAKLRREYHEALETLAESARERGEPREAARWWRDRVDDDPYDSRVTARLMAALAETGNRAEALRIGRDHERLLADELSTTPGEAVLELRQRLETDTAAPREISANGGRTEAPEGSIAVLPFEVLGASPEATGVFASGLHADLVNELARCESLTVISRTSVLGYRDTNRRLSDIARELGVRALVEGEVQHVDDRIRVRVQLIDAASDTHLWSERWDRELTARNLFEVQGELTREVADRLAGGSDPVPHGLGTRGRPSTEDLEAYRLHASGRAHLEQSSEAALVRAVDLFRAAIARDERYPDAWAGLAEGLARLVSYHHRAPGADLVAAEEAARRAVELAPKLAVGHSALGLALAVARRGPEALRSLYRAVDLSPGDAHALSSLAMVLGPLGHWEEGIAYMERACRLDPASPEMHYCLAERYTLPGASVEESLAHARRAQALSPGYAEGYLIEGRILTDTGRAEEAIPRVRQGLDLASESSRGRHLYSLASAYVTAGRSDDAEQVLEETAGDQSTFFEGALRAVLGDIEGAFARFRETDWSLLRSYHLRYDPALASVREDPRFDELLGHVNGAWGLEPDGAAQGVVSRA